MVGSTYHLADASGVCRSVNKIIVRESSESTLRENSSLLGGKTYIYVLIVKCDRKSLSASPLPV